MTAGLTLARIAIANEAEYHAILAFYQMTLAELMHCFKIEEFVVTLGDKGGFVQMQNGETFHYEAAMIKTPVDSTGAGDVFLAAYIVSRVVDNKDISDACIYAAKIAARQVEGKYITPDFLARIVMDDGLHQSSRALRGVGSTSRRPGQAQTNANQAFFPC